MLIEIVSLYIIQIGLIDPLHLIVNPIVISPD